MIRHNDVRRGAVEIVAIDVEASGIVDLRYVSALQAVGIDLEDALAPWQAIVEAGGTPRSWTVRDRLIEVGANGLIDPSRKTPGLWHPVLFRWNVADAPSARLLDTQRLGEGSDVPRGTSKLAGRAGGTRCAGVPRGTSAAGSGEVVADRLLGELGVGPAEIEAGSRQRLWQQ
jgi:hypothetical protein